jgi:hypothetical protein
LNSPEDEHYSRALDQHYEFDGQKLTFEDGISYTLAEAVEVAKKARRDEDVRAVHLVKRVFDGEVLDDTRRLTPFELWHHAKRGALI